MRREATFKKDLETCNKVAKEVLKRSTKKGISGFEYPPPDSYWASHASIVSFKKLANFEMEYRKSLGQKKPSSLVFATEYDGFIEV